MSESNFTPTQADLHNYFDYKDGVLYWKISKKCVNKGGIAGHVDYSRPYVRITINRQKHLAHRLIYMMFHGSMPKIIDHINGNPSDNRLCNLRLADRSLNMQNQRRARSDSATGVLGVRKNGSGYRAEIRVGGKRINLGTYPTTELAHIAYVEAKRKHHEGCTI